jgi:hypothetical protein
MQTVGSKSRWTFFAFGLSAILIGYGVRSRIGWADSAPPVVWHFEHQPDLPSSWKVEPIKQTDTHVAHEWRSLTGRTVLGTVYIHVPPLMPAHALVKTVKEHYVKDQTKGKITDEWTDSAGRHWFEVDADGTHTKGYVIARDGHAWFAYYRYQTHGGRSKK